MKCLSVERVIFCDILCKITRSKHTRQICMHFTHKIKYSNRFLANSINSSHQLYGGRKYGKHEHITQIIRQNETSQPIKYYKVLSNTNLISFFFSHDGALCSYCIHVYNWIKIYDTYVISHFKLLRTYLLHQTDLLWCHRTKTFVSNFFILTFLKLMTQSLEWNELIMKLFKILFNNKMCFGNITQSMKGYSKYKGHSQGH